MRKQNDTPQENLGLVVGDHMKKILKESQQKDANIVRFFLRPITAYFQTFFFFLSSFSFFLFFLFLCSIFITQKQESKSQDKWNISI